MADREYVITFDGDKARVALAPGPPIRRRFSGDIASHHGDHFVTKLVQPPEYHIFAPSAQRAEQIARAMRKPKKEEA